MRSLATGSLATGQEPQGAGAGVLLRQLEGGCDPRSYIVPAAEGPGRPAALTGIGGRDMLFNRRPNVTKLSARRNLPGLVRAVGYTGDWRVRAAAAGSLGQLGDARAVDALVTALRDDQEGVREAAAAALGRLGDPRAVNPLVAVACDTRFIATGMVEAAFAALASIGAPSVEALVTIVDDHEQWWVRRRDAIKVLAQIGDARRGVAGRRSRRTRGVRLPSRRRGARPLRVGPGQRRPADRVLHRQAAMGQVR